MSAFGILRQSLGAVLPVFVFAVQIFLGLVLVLLESLWRAIRRNAKLKPVPSTELKLPLLSARLTDLPYLVEEEEEIKAGIESLLPGATLLHFEEQQLMQTNAVWFLAEGPDPLPVASDGPTALFLVFRGTNSPTDAIADVLFRPDESGSGIHCHGGFLRTVREDKALAAALEEHVAGSAKPLYVMGHSLGGALSQIVVGAGLLPPTFTGRLTVVNLGGPVTFFGAVAPAALPALAAGARVLTIVNGNDIVPRLLGGPLSFTRYLLLLFASGKSAKQRARNEALIETLQKYRGFPQEELFFVYNAQVLRVPAADRLLVLHLAESLHPRAVADHLAYVPGLEAAAGAPAWAPPTLRS